MDPAAAAAATHTDGSTLRRWSSRQFVITMTGMALMFAATWHGGELVPLSTVIVVAITGQAGINAMERRKP